jgi:hypothetical protein
MLPSFKFLVQVSRYFRLRAELDDLEADIEVLTSSPSVNPSQQEVDNSGIQKHHRPSEVLKVMRTELTSMRGRLAKVFFGTKFIDWI